MLRAHMPALARNRGASCLAISGGYLPVSIAPGLRSLCLSVGPGMATRESNRATCRCDGLHGYRCASHCRSTPLSSRSYTSITSYAHAPKKVDSSVQSLIKVNYQRSTRGVYLDAADLSMRRGGAAVREHDMYVIVRREPER